MAAKKRSRKSPIRKKKSRLKKKTKTSLRAPKRKAATRKSTLRAKRSPNKRRNSSKRGSASRTQDRTYPVRKPGLSENQSGDLQNLSTTEDIGSESIDELAAEGNAFEADVLQGVEDAENEEEHEVRTHEVPEDDVPSEYQDEE